MIDDAKVPTNCLFFSAPLPLNNNHTLVQICNKVKIQQSPQNNYIHKGVMTVSLEHSKGVTTEGGTPQKQSCGLAGNRTLISWFLLMNVTFTLLAHKIFNIQYVI